MTPKEALQKQKEATTKVVNTWQTVLSELSEKAGFHISPGLENDGQRKPLDTGALQKELSDLYLTLQPWLERRERLAVTELSISCPSQVARIQVPEKVKRLCSEADCVLDKQKLKQYLLDKISAPIWSPATDETLRSDGWRQLMENTTDYVKHKILHGLSWRALSEAEPEVILRHLKTHPIQTDSRERLEELTFLTMDQLCELLQCKVENICYYPQIVLLRAIYTKSTLVDRVDYWSSKPLEQYMHQNTQDTKEFNWTEEYLKNNIEERRSLWSALLELTKPKAHDNAEETVSLVLKLTAKLVGMYCNEEDLDKRFHIITVNDLKYPAIETSFRKPGCALFKLAIRVYLLPGKQPGQERIEAVRQALVRVDASNMTHLLLVPGETESVLKALEREIRSGKVIIINRTLMKEIIESPRAHVPLRRVMRREDIEAYSPFVTEGRVLEEQNIFVGRSEILRRLTQGRCWLVWGGRRIGKTSLLHAVKSRMESLKKSKYKTVYLSLDGVLRQVPYPEQDDIISKLVAKELGWSTEPSNLIDFRDRLREHCGREPVCILLDEMDQYIKSHNKNKSTEFRIIRDFRDIRNEVGENLVCIFVGFDETTELVKEGFGDILGLSYEPTIPQKIFKCTAGHPAFVQMFCERVLHYLKAQGQQGTPKVTQGILDEVINDRDSPEHRFIYFVKKTLDMNLSKFERIIIYVFAEQCTCKNTDNLERAEIEEEVNCLCKNSRKSERTRAQYDEAFRYLMMTGMLQEAEGRNRVK